MQQFHSGSGFIKESGKDDIVDIKLESRLLRSKLPPATAGPVLSRARAHETQHSQLPSISHDKPIPKRIDILNKKFHKFFKHVRKLPQQRPQMSPEKLEEPPIAMTYRENLISQETISRFRLHRATFVNNRHNSIEHESPEQTTREIKIHALDPTKIDTT